ncbi:MAG: cardiolipin synthase [Pseudomonadota bacterium]|nr:cardiolipin synthase [Pseudomonadota bacterium]
MLIGSLLILLIELFGIFNAIHAIMYTRSAQGAIAWAIALITFPIITIPLYWIFGRDKFRGWINAHRVLNSELKTTVQQLDQRITEFERVPSEALLPLHQLAKAITAYPFLRGHSVHLLINGEQTFETLLAAIDAACEYILFQFYIVRDDEIGNTFKRALIEKAQHGVRVYFIYDEIGSYPLSTQYLGELQQAGIEVTSFGSTTKTRRLQINFRNHRKVVVIDGRKAFTGGLNIGNEYWNRIELNLGFWRDTHLLIEGPAVQCIQLSFLEDWYWATRTIPTINTHIEVKPDHNAAALVLATGPADDIPISTLFFLSVFCLAKKRLWISSPYFVPDETIVAALQRAALTGVDVRILLPGRPDTFIVYLSSFSYYAELFAVGIKIYRYQAGFNHQKVILVDDLLAGVGSANIDNRSFRLNFELTTFVAEEAFIKAVEQMFLEDFAQCHQVQLFEYEHRSFWFKTAVSVARLMAPLQ